jgi:hypothetical protein
MPCCIFAPHLIESVMRPTAISRRSARYKRLRVPPSIQSKSQGAVSISGLQHRLFWGVHVPPPGGPFAT